MRKSKASSEIVNELPRLGFELYAAYAALQCNEINSPKARAASRALSRALAELDKNYPYLERASGEPPEVERLGTYINPHNSAAGAANLALIIALGDRVAAAEQAFDEAIARGAPYHCHHALCEIRKKAPTCTHCALTVAGDEFDDALRAVDPCFYIAFNKRGFPDNPRGQITAAAVQLAEAWSYFRAFACDADLPERNAIVAAVGIEIATRKLKALKEDWQRKLERAQQMRSQKRIRRRPLYRNINGQRVRIYRPDEIEALEPIEETM